MELILPGIGLIFWMTLSFSIVLFILKKFAWKPISATIRRREAFIAQSLEDAEEINRQKSEMQALKDSLFKQGLQEKEAIILEAKKQKEQIIKEAHEAAREEARKVMEQAHLSLQAEKEQAIKELRSEIALISVDMAEKILKNELEDKNKQKDMVYNLLGDVSSN